MKRSFSVPYAPPQNAHAERMWGILLRTMRITIAESKISERFWTYAMQNAVRLHNSLPSTKLENNMSPYQAFTGKLPNLGRFRVFGCVAWYYLPEHERSSKIGPRALPAINLGCDPERNGWLVYIPQLNRISTMCIRLLRRAGSPSTRWRRRRRRGDPRRREATSRERGRRSLTAPPRRSLWRKENGPSTSIGTRPQEGLPHHRPPLARYEG